MPIKPVVAGVMLVLAACGPSSRNGGGSDGGQNGSGDGGACASAIETAHKAPLDLYVMLDQSSSMSDAVTGGTKWSAVTGALNSFMMQPGLDGISIGLQYFGVPSGQTCSVLQCTQTSDCGASACGPCVAGFCVGALGGAGDSCTASDYATPNVEIAALPAVASPIEMSISHHSPSTSTPTSAALQGAIDHATSWAHAHAGDATVVVLATDGDPTECDTSITNIEAIATAGYTASPHVPTAVIGVGSSTSNLNGIAMAGGTHQAFIVDTNQNVAQQFLAAMNAIRGLVACTYQIPVPQSGAPDYGQVNVEFTPTGGSPQTIPNVADKAHCPAAGMAWYYDDPAMPSSIILCDATCATVQGDATATVNIALGCNTVIF